MEFTIIPMEKVHVSAVATLEGQCFSAPWSEASIASELDNPLSLWMVALEEERLLGYIGSQMVLPEADMMNLAVIPEARRQGVGRALVLALCKALRERGAETLTLEVRASNVGARKLYENLGFAQVGLRRNYYFSPKEDGVILRKEL